MFDDKIVDELSKESILRHLKTAADLNIEVQGTVTSTNSVLMEEAFFGEHEGKVLIASRQTGGKGRKGRKFFSPADSGLYMSILLRPDLPADKAVYITTAAAVAVCRAVERECSRTLQIKWVNDVLLDGKKLCGILTESALDAQSGRLQYAVLGLGLNVYFPAKGFPADIADIATAIFTEQYEDMRNRLAAAILDEFFAIYPNIADKDFLDEYRNRNIVPGRRIIVQKTIPEKEASALEIDDDFHLRVKYSDGWLDTISSGDITLMPE